MAPPTTLYNNTTAKHTRYEQTSPTQIPAVELVFAKAMLTRDIEKFNTDAPAGTMDTQFSLTTPATSTSEQLTHLQIDSQEPELGAVFALGALHNEDATKGVPGSDAPSHLSFPISSGLIGSNLATNSTRVLSLSDDSASHYDSQLVFTTDNTDNVYEDNEDFPNKEYRVTFDAASPNYNGDRATNSRLSNYLQGALATAAPDVHKTDPLKISEAVAFNSVDSLYTENTVARDLVNNQLSAGSTLTNAMKTLINTSGQNYYDSNTGFIGSGFSGIKSIDQSGANNRVFFGAIKVTQDDPVITISGNAAGSTSTTLSKIPSDQGSPLPTSMSRANFEDLFTSTELPHVGDGYSLDITSTTTDGGYYTYGTIGTGPFRGFTTDDTSVKRNTTYMRKCAEEGQDFSQSVQTVEINNGDHIPSRTFAGPNAGLLINRVDAAATDVNGNPTPYDTDEKLSSSQYQTDSWVRSYFTEPSTSSVATYKRAESGLGNTSNYTNFTVAYDTSEDPLTLPVDRRSRYHNNFDITNVFPNTSVSGSVFSGSAHVGINQGFAAVFQKELDTNGATIVKNGINLNSDYTFTSSAAAADKISDNEVGILHLKNTMLMSNENTMFTDATTSTGIVGTTASVLGSEIDLTKLPTKDLRVLIAIKGGNVTGQGGNIPNMNSVFSNGWYTLRLSGNFFTLNGVTSNTNIFGTDIYNIMANPNNIVPMTMKITTNGAAANRDLLTTGCEIAWTWNGTPKTYLIPEVVQVNINNSNAVPTGKLENLVKDVDYKLTTFASNSALIASKLANVSLKRRFETRTFVPQFTLPMGAYSNYGIRGVSMSILTTYYVLEDANGNKLPDSYLNHLEGLNGVSLLATRVINEINTKASTVVTFSAKDLYGARATIQALDTNNNWLDVSPPIDYDPVFSNVGTFILNNAAGTITATTDITNNANPTSGNAVNLGNATQDYYIGLTTDQISYSVVGRTWNINTLADAQAITSWAATKTIYSTSFPNAGTAINGLGAKIAFTSPEGSDLRIQPDVTLTVTDSDGTVWAKFVTDSKNISSNFNILFSRRPVFHIVESFKPVTITVGAAGVSWAQAASDTVVHTYKMAGNSTQLQVIDGVKLIFLNDTGINDSGSFRLLGDYVEGSLYTGYAGPYSTLSEVTFVNGLAIKDSISRGIDIKYYRGNSVRTASAPAIFEEFRWTRRPTQINMKIVNTNSSNVSVTYTDSKDDLYDGSLHTVTNLSGGINDLSLKFIGNLSRIRTVNTVHTSQDVAMSQPITVKFDFYTWILSNLYNTDSNSTTTAGAANALSAATSVVPTNKYSIKNYTGSGNPMNIVASRVWIRGSETYNINLTAQDLKVDYLAEQYVGNPSTFDWSQSSRIDTIIYADLITGRYLKTPSTIAGGVKDSNIFIRRAPISVKSHVGYFLMPRPQHVIEAIATNAVSGLPYNFTTAVRTVRYFDIDLEANSHNPFAGGFGTINGLPGTARVVNDMTVEFKNSELYVDRRFASATNSRPIYIPSIKITIDLYKGYSSHTTSGLDSTLKISTVYSGHVHKLKNYDVDAYSVSDVYSDSLGKAIDNGIYNVFSSSGRNTYIDGYFNVRGDMTYDMKFSQDYSIISPGILPADIYGQNNVKVVNIVILGISPFMNLNGVSVANRHLDLLPGDSLSLALYGHTITTDVNNNLVAEFVRYKTGIGYDFTTNAAEFFIRNLGFNASTRETATVILKTPSSVLTATPFNLVNLCRTVASSSSFNSLTWVNDPNWVNKSTQEKQLKFNMTCLSTVGQSKLLSILGTSARSPYRFLVAEYPYRIDLRSGDGSPLYQVNAFGVLSNCVTKTQVLELQPSMVNSSDSDVTVHTAYNILKNNTF